jgi:bacterioferritin (cytochrome b1)
MEKLNTKKQFLEGLKNLLAVESLARDSYKSDMMTFNNFKLVDTIEKIKDDEDNHIYMLKQLIKMLEKKEVK